MTKRLPTTKLFLDSADLAETKQALALLGRLDGQTTNPTKVAQHPEVQSRLKSGKKFSKSEIYGFYKEVAQEIAGVIPDGSVSLEVYADHSTTADEMFMQGKELFGWIPNAHIKYPTTSAGLEAAEYSIAAGMRVNMTLVFSQAQAAAVYSATRGAKKGSVFVSPFIGRLDDKGQNGMQLIQNCIKMYKESDKHVEILTASVRSNEHIEAAIRLGADIITAPYKALASWHNARDTFDSDFQYNPGDLAPIPYEQYDLTADWRSFDIHHPLTDAGIDEFANDWNQLIAL